TTTDWLSTSVSSGMLPPSSQQITTATIAWSSSSESPLYGRIMIDSSDTMRPHIAVRISATMVRAPHTFRLPLAALQ
ncbi:MAG: hypothetical protein IPO81_26595, partial [Kouleothrix sp.]|nr:hypothetical protein [Kouleothrix sp.]